MGQKILGVVYEGKSYLVEYTSDTEFTMTDQEQKKVESKDVRTKKRSELDRILKVKTDFDIEQKKRDDVPVNPDEPIKTDHYRLIWKQALAAGIALAAISTAIYYFF